MLEIIVCDDNALHCKEIVKSVQAALDGTPAEISDFPDAGRLLDYLRSTWRGASSNMHPDARLFS